MWKGSNEMKFYEFNDFGYYALIGADSMEDAIKEYVEEVADIEEEDKDEEPNEITRQSAWHKYKEAVESETLFKFESDILKDFEYQINNNKTVLLLID